MDVMEDHYGGLLILPIGMGLLSRENTLVVAAILIMGAIVVTNKRT